MKNTFKMAAGFCAMLFAFGCNIDNTAVEETVKSEPFDFKISALLSNDTRTAIGELTDGEYPFTWEPTDELAIAEFADGTSTQTAKAAISELTDDNKSANFTTKFEKKSGSVFDYYAYYPYGAYSADALTLPAEQTPRAASVDPAGSLLFASKTGLPEQAESVSLLFDHISAYAKMTVTGLDIADDAKIYDVKFTVKDKALAGTFSHDTKTNSIEAVDKGVSTVTMLMSQHQYGGKEPFDVWFSTLPAENIAEFSVEVRAGLNVYSKTFKVGSNRTFGLEQGIVSSFTVNMANADVVSGTIPDNEIHYTTIGDGKLNIEGSGYYVDGRTFGKDVYLVSNTYENGKGILRFSAPVTEIGPYVFYSGMVSWANLKTITLPETVTSIETSAFHNCITITEITIPDAVTRIESDAFNTCQSLKKVTLGKNLQHIGQRAFFGSALECIEIPNSVTTIGTSAFELCRSLEKAQLSGSLTQIDKRMFSECKKLKEVTIPENVEVIAESAFDYCESIESMDIPASVTEIGMYAFRNCKNMATCTFHEGLLSIAYYAFASSGVKSIRIPDSVTYLSHESFRQCLNLESLVIGDGITSGVVNYIEGCIYLESITFGKGFSEIQLSGSSCINLKYIYCKSSTPPICKITYLPDDFQTVYVPANSVEEYKAASSWSTLADKIKGYNF